MLWKSLLRDYFSFSRAERFGLVVLCGCILLVLVIRWSLPYLSKRQAPDVAAYEKEIALFRKSVDSVLLAKNQPAPSVHAPTTAEYFYFDPNGVSDEDWEKLGLNKRQIRNIRNYQAKGGQFRRREDVKKLYTISATQYQLLEPYIRIAANKAVEKTIKTETSTTTDAKKTESAQFAVPFRKETKIHIELNAADSSLLTRLPGIGPVLAARTVKYRNTIGGFANVAQLGEVYGIRQELVGQLTEQLSADSSLIKKIPVNTATFKDLIGHPYLNKQHVQGILYYRKLQTRIHTLDELVKNHILEHETAEKIKPYLRFD